MAAESALSYIDGTAGSLWYRGYDVHALARHADGVIAGLSSAERSQARNLLLANQFFVTPSDGGVLMLKAYIAVTVGGWGSLRGAVAGALLIAAFEVAVASQFSQPLAEGLLYVTLFVVLFFRPQGLFGETARLRA